MDAVPSSTSTEGRLDMTEHSDRPVRDDDHASYDDDRDAIEAETDALLGVQARTEEPPEDVPVHKVVVLPHGHHGVATTDGLATADHSSDYETPRSDADSDDSQPLLRQQPAEEPVDYLQLLCWLTMGLGNNVVYIVYLAAAEDILEGYAGAVLLASIAPSLVVKSMLPIVQHLLPYHARMPFVVAGIIASLVTTAKAENDMVKIVGVAINSVAGGAGEVTLLSFSALFPPYYFTAWAAGTGMSGIVGAGVYVVLRHIWEFDSETSLFMLIPVPCFLLLAFWFLAWKLYRKRREREKAGPKEDPTFNDDGGDDDEEDQGPNTFYKRITFIPSLFKYMGPLFLVYLSEYSINQGVASSYLNKRNYVIWQFCYQIGVFFSRTSIQYMKIQRIGLLAVLQLINFCVLLNVMPFMKIEALLVFAFYEGLLGGFVYVNAFFRVATEQNSKWREFAMAVTCMADTFGISVAAVVSIGLENALRGGDISEIVQTENSLPE